MKSIMFLATIFLGLRAFAVDVQLVPVNPINCATDKYQPASFLSVRQLGADAERTHFEFQIQTGHCGNGKKNLDDIQPDFNLYFVNQEYNSDVRYDYNILTRNTIEARFSIIPQTFFQQTKDRHFVVSYYPTKDAKVFAWNVTFSQDPVTQEISIAIQDLRAR